MIDSFKLVSRTCKVVLCHFLIPLEINLLDPFYKENPTLRLSYLKVTIIENLKRKVLSIQVQNTFYCAQYFPRIVIINFFFVKKNFQGKALKYPSTCSAKLRCNNLCISLEKDSFFFQNVCVSC